jgi:hypothetical protein
MKKQTIMMFGLIAVASLMTVVAFGNNTTHYLVGNTESAPEGIKILGHLEMVATDSDGNIKYYQQTDNAIQEQGANCIISALFGALPESTDGDCNYGTSGVGNFTSMQIGTGTGAALSATAVTGTALIDNGGKGTDASGAVIKDTTTGNNAAGFGANATVSVPFTANGVVAITEAILTNSTSLTNNATLAYRNFSAINLADGDSLTVSWTVSVNEG